MTATLQGELLKSLVTASQVKLQGQNIMVFELYLIKYLKYRSHIQIQPSLKSQIQIRMLPVFKYKYVFDPNPDRRNINFPHGPHHSVSLTKHKGLDRNRPQLEMNARHLHPSPTPARHLRPRASHIKMEGERFLALLKWPRGVNSAPGISSPQNH